MKHILCLLISLMGLQVLSAQNHPCSRAKLMDQIGLYKTEVNSDLATRLMDKYDIHHYDIEIEARLSSTVYEGEVTISAEVVAAAMDSLCFQMSSTVNMDSVWLDGVYYPSLRVGDDVIVTPSSSIPQGQSFQLRVRYASSYSSGGLFTEGIRKDKYHFTPDTVVSTMSSPYFMRYWLPAKEVLADKIDSIDVTVLSEKPLKVASNGLLVKHDTVGNLSRFHWKSNYPIAYYLINFTVADYELDTRYAYPSSLTGDSVLVQNFIFSDPTLKNYILPRLDSNNRMLEYFSDQFGLYPFHEEKYGCSLAPIGGAMEHQTMTTLGAVNLSVQAHELMHQWFGDYVTCASYQDISINEGFATFGQILTESFFYGPDAAAKYRKDMHDEIKSLAGGSVYCTDTSSINRIFDGRLSYYKGGAVMSTLRYIMGDSLFFSGCRYFLQQHAFGTASFADLHADMESYSGLDLDFFFDQWIYGEGYPLVFVKYWEDGNEMKMELKQVNALSGGIGFFEGPIDVEITDQSGNTVRHRLDWMYNDQTFVLPYSGVASNITVDPDAYVIHETASIKRDSTVALHEPLRTLEWQVFPVPFGPYLELISDHRAVAVEMIDMLGRLVVSEDMNGYRSRISTAHLPSGRYMVRLILEDGSSATKFVSHR